MFSTSEKNKIFVTVFASLLGVVGEAESATLVTALNVQGSGGADCNDINAERDISAGGQAATITSVTSNCSGQGLYGPQVSFAEATFGTLRAVAGVTAGQSFDSSSTSGTTTFPTSSAEAFFSDRLSFGIDSGSFIIPVDVLGSLSGSVSSDVSGYRLAAAFTVFSQLSAINFRESGVVVKENTGVNNRLENTSIDTVRDVSIPINSGFADLGFSVEVFAQCNASTINIQGQSVVCSADAIFGNSLRLLGGTVLDVDGNEVTTTVTAESGFDYLEGAEPHSRNPAVIPLPSPLPLLAFGIAALALFHRLHRKIGF